MLNNIDTKNAETIKIQLEELKSIVSELIDTKTGLPKPNTTKTQILFAIEQIRYIQSIYDERAQAHEELNEDVEKSKSKISEVTGMMQEVKRKYGNIYPDWAFKMFGL